MVVRKKKNTRSGGDRISQLPDHLICHILFHLPTKDAVRTSVLTTRWRNLWQCVLGLDLDSGNFPSFTGFFSFGGRFFDFHKDSWIEKLCLSIHDIGYKFDLTSWIDAVTRRRIQHLDVRFIGTCSYSDIPLSLYTCKTLVHLRLFGVALVNPEFVSLPCLKSIHLEYNYYPSETTFEKLISGSPVLEDLTVIRFKHDREIALQVRSQTLKRIYINEFTQVVVVAPLLQCLRTKIYSTKKFEIITSGFFAKQDIDDNGLDPNFLVKRRVIRDTLTDISRVRDLVISCDTWKDIFPYPKWGPLLQFCYVSRLGGRFSNLSVEMLPHLLKRCPKLESLILELVEDRFVRSRKNREPHVMFSTVPPCLVSSLKFVELKTPISGYEREMELVRYFLKNSTILEKLTLRLSDNENKKKSNYLIIQELVAMPRCSSVSQTIVR